MKFDTPATTNPIDQLKVVGKPLDRIDGVVKTTGTAPYAYERHDVAPNPAYGYVVGSPSPRAGSASMDLGRARRAPGVITIVTAETAGTLGKGSLQHRHAARRAADRSLPPGDRAGRGRDLRAGACRGAAGAGRLRPRAGNLRPRQGHGTARRSPSASPAVRPIRRSATSPAPSPPRRCRSMPTYTTPDQSHAMMEPHATHRRVATATSSRSGPSNQMVDWGRGDLAKTLGIDKRRCG